MEASIRNHIKQNFINSSNEELTKAINEAVAANTEVILPGLGVFFEVLWNNSSSEFKNSVVSTIKTNLK